MGGFIERKRELAELGRCSAQVGTGDRPGRVVFMRGKRRVGKSRLVEEFIRRSDVPSFFFTAARQSPAAQLGRFIATASSSDLPDAILFEEAVPTSWESALKLLARAVPQASPSIVVLDELPLLIGGEPHLEGLLRHLVDHELCRRPTMVILIGSDLSLMEKVNPYDTRASEMVPASTRRRRRHCGLTPTTTAATPAARC
jgi:uncharacterized protein